MSEDDKRALKREMFLGSALIAAGLILVAVSSVQLKTHDPSRMAQATQPVQPLPPSEKTAPAESKPGGERPTTPAPEPARPDPEAQKAGARPVLPPAPAEKMAPPIKESPPK
jgi:hypothetical protein